ncbi:MAG TPA: GNAT family N-acetyltransferase [Gemmatimonadales bacterium]|nr:GNAT family N-acetyltransferase [Gemmatimonadales bacterium]
MADPRPQPTPRLLTGPEAADQVIEILREAFADYPVMRYVLGADGDYAERLRTLIGFFVAARVLRGDPMFAVSSGSELTGVAICTLPGGSPPPELDAVRERTWATLGPGALERYQHCVRAWEPLAVAEPNLHVNMLGVRPRYQGRGLSRLLLERVHALSRELPDSAGVTLTTETATNVALYQRFGYRIVGHREIAPGLETWGFYRPD